MKFHPNPLAIFETTRSEFIQILYRCSMSRKITPLYLFNLKCHIFWTKISHQNKTFGPLSGWVKMYKISHVIFETFLMS